MTTNHEQAAKRIWQSVNSPGQGAWRYCLTCNRIAKVCITIVVTYSQTQSWVTLTSDLQEQIRGFTLESWERTCFPSASLREMLNSSLGLGWDGCDPHPHTGNSSQTLSQSVKRLEEGLNSLQNTRVGLNRKKSDELFTENMKMNQAQPCFAREEELRLCLNHWNLKTTILGQAESLDFLAVGRKFFYSCSCALTEEELSPGNRWEGATLTKKDISGSQVWSMHWHKDGTVCAVIWKLPSGRVRVG